MSQTTLQHQIQTCYQSYFGDQLVSVLDILTNDRIELPVSELISVQGSNGSDVLLGSPVVLSVPHAGFFVPSEYIGHFDVLDKHLIEVDLYAHLPYEKVDATVVSCFLAPMFIDMNRDRSGGAGKQLPHHLQNNPYNYFTIKDQPILVEPYNPADIDAIMRYYDMYHELIGLLLAGCVKKFGYAILLDGHSMNSKGLGRVHDTGQPRSDIDIGNLNGKSASDIVTNTFVSALDEALNNNPVAVSVALNKPYSGGFITRKHHDPARGVHALQVEVAMAAYMFEPGDLSGGYPLVIKSYRLAQLQKAIKSAAGSLANLS